ncbi:TetR/AcrR family transcriptional regulator [Microbacterium sp. TNHR37B]|uniref:TetR/AcrR family transcriptional regulator n=1 Tax=Microbacterium sp. TNHR37B TaxID=1775956 RepID=UPI0007B19CFB|nr:TetR/AcrR family transcriptional regulator [Microbacterium sp. TNHR37B]KZE91120.1 hypothetical protein AVP41_00654 [Microbacterium sp. TNHR37B]
MAATSTGGRGRGSGLIVVVRIDPQQREREIAAAALRVLERDGIAGVSVRAVAAESGLAVASLRRAFPTQEALRRFCLAEIRSRAGARIRAVEGEGVARAVGVLEELLPLDAERRLELVAQIQLGMLSVTDESLRADARALHDDVRGVCRAVLAWSAGDTADPDALNGAAARLHAFLDGLALHALTAPDETDTAAVRDRLRAYLQDNRLPRTSVERRVGASEPETTIRQGETT